MKRVIPVIIILTAIISWYPHFTRLGAGHHSTETNYHHPVQRDEKSQLGAAPVTLTQEHIPLQSDTRVFAKLEKNQNGVTGKTQFMSATSKIHPAVHKTNMSESKSELDEKSWDYESFQHVGKRNLSTNERTAKGPKRHSDLDIALSRSTWTANATGSYGEKQKDDVQSRQDVESTASPKDMQDSLSRQRNLNHSPSKREDVKLQTVTAGLPFDEHPNPPFSSMDVVSDIPKLERNGSRSSNEDVQPPENKDLYHNTNRNGTQFTTSTTVVNPHDFKYIINNETLCTSSVDTLSYLVFFHSKPSSKTERDELRRTWAQQNLFLNHNSRLLFFMGDPNDVNVFDDVRDESAQYGDIVMEEFLDSYNNMTYKAIGGLKWIRRFCPNVKYIIKSDQDIYFNMFRLINLLQTKYVNATRFFLCQLYTDGAMPILRNRPSCSKWCVPPDILPGQHYYPPYCSGSAFVYTSDMVNELYTAALQTPYFYIDDVYMTGLVVQKLQKVRLIDSGEGSYKIGDKDIKRTFQNGGNAAHDVMVVHGPDVRWHWTWHVALLPDDQIALIGQEKYAKLLAEALEPMNSTAGIQG